MRRSPVRVRDWNWNWTAVRPERYIFLNILVTVRNRLVTQPCHLLATTHYVATYVARYVPGHRRAIARALCCPPSTYVATHATPKSSSFGVYLHSCCSLPLAVRTRRALYASTFPRTLRDREVRSPAFPSDATLLTSQPSNCAEEIVGTPFLWCTN